MNNRNNKNNKPRNTSGNKRRSSNSNEYNSTPSNRFYTAKEELKLRFYQVPKSLFKNPTYKGLSLGAKLMYSILRDRLDISIKNDWEDENGFIYLIFGGEDLLNLLEISKNTVTKYKRELVKNKLIIDKRLGQGKANRIYILKPEIKNFRIPIIEIAEELEDDHSLGAFRTIADKIPEQQIRIFFSIIKDTHLTGKINKNKGALFISLAKAYAKKNNINLNFN